MWGITRKSIIHVTHYYYINEKYSRSINYYNTKVSNDFNDKGYFILVKRHCIDVNVQTQIAYVSA